VQLFAAMIGGEAQVVPSVAQGPNAESARSTR